MALKSHDSVPSEVLKFLQDLGCCFRCSLRFGGVRNSEDYQSEEVYLNMIELSKRILCIIFFLTGTR